jgi:hypothetical protein
MKIFNIEIEADSEFSKEQNNLISKFNALTHDGSLHTVHCGYGINLYEVTTEDLVCGMAKDLSAAFRNTHVVIKFSGKSIKCAIFRHGLDDTAGIIFRSIPYNRSIFA